MGFFDKLKQGLGKTKSSIDDKINNVFSVFRKVDEELLEELEEILIMSDIGMETSIKIIDNLRDKAKKEKIESEEELKKALKSIMKEILDVEDTKLNLDTKPSIILIVGVNGVGKTTSIGKLASMNKKKGKKVLLAAADTFRAGAIDQLVVWSERAKVDIVKHEEGSDPAAVVFDAINASKSRGVDLLICDTAGRLHNKKNLMDELEKMKKIIDKNISKDIYKETIMVLDSTTGQNGAIQAKLFLEKTNVNGIFLTKLDSTSKGGVVFSIVDELKIPIKYIGVGETIDDIEIFDAKSFVEAIV